MEELLESWVDISGAFVRKLGVDGVSVAKGKKCCAEPGAKGDYANWWNLSLDQVLTGWLSFAILNFTLLGGVVWECSGIPTGGVLSTSLLYLALSGAEWRWRKSRKKRRASKSKGQSMKP